MFSFLGLLAKHFLGPADQASYSAGCEVGKLSNIRGDLAFKSLSQPSVNVYVGSFYVGFPNRCSPETTTSCFYLFPHIFTNWLEDMWRTEKTVRRF